MSSYSPNMQLQVEDIQGLSRVRVNDSNTNDLLREVIIQLKLVSVKLDPLQPNDEIIAIDDLDNL